MRKQRNTLLLEYTEIPPAKSAAEIVAQLVAIGANEINQSYQDGKLVGIRWVFTVHGQPQLFEMPVRTDGVFALLQERRRRPYRSEEGDRIQAERIAWRHLLAWVKVQVAMIQTDMAKPEQVFLPYLWDPASKRTLFQWMNDRQFKALPAPEKPQ